MQKHHHILPAWRTASQRAMLRLPELVEALHMRHSVTAYVGCELEWYVDQPGNDVAITQTYEAVMRKAEKEGLRISAIKPESGNGQYEVAFAARDNPSHLAQEIHDFRVLLSEQTGKHGLSVLWDAKPFEKDYGNALQLHVHLEDSSGERLFLKQGDHLSPALAASIGGLLDITPATMLIAAPQESSYARFVPGFDAPVNVSWGANNRSVTLRLPYKNGPQCHIEYRLAGADADPASMLGVVLAGVLHGLESKPPAGRQIHGIASDNHYALPALPRKLEEAKSAFHGSDVLRKWMGEGWFEAVEALYACKVLG